MASFPLNSGTSAVLRALEVEAQALTLWYLPLLVTAATVYRIAIIQAQQLLLWTGSQT